LHITFQQKVCQLVSVQVWQVGEEGAIEGDGIAFFGVEAHTVKVGGGIVCDEGVVPDILVHHEAGAAPGGVDIDKEEAFLETGALEGYVQGLPVDLSREGGYPQERQAEKGF
jgi:hypothetical protein